MLYPQQNHLRQIIDLSGMWSFLPDLDGKGEMEGWQNGLSDSRVIAVPSSWNEQHSDLRDYLGDSWYQTQFDLPLDWQNRHIFLRFGSVNYLADVWLNGEYLGQHEGGHLPFEFDVWSHLKTHQNQLVVRVNGELSPARVPPGNLRTRDDWHDSFTNIEFPAGNFDFFPYCGIHRPVVLYCVARTHLHDLTITTHIYDSHASVDVRAECTAADDITLRLALHGHGQLVTISTEIKHGQASASLHVAQPQLWSPEHPTLYDLTAEIVRDDVVVDSYTIPVGIRTIEVDGSQLLLNGESIFLQGYALHEDFPALGRGVVPAVTVKDFNLMLWSGANSFRTSHYPYAEDTLLLADRLGLLVISETPAVGMFFHEDGLDRRLETWREQTKALIQRDKNHPSVVMWCLANEPHSHRPGAREAFEQIFAIARSMDMSRPLTYTTYMGTNDPAIDLCDVVSLNRYRGWYSEVGQIEKGVRVLEQELADIFDQLQRPILISEFGADAVSGHHANPSELFSEEYQAEFIEAYHKLFEHLSYVIGEHVWTLCDFKTNQSVRRVGSLNLKGVFTRDRRPKLAAHTLHRLWKGQTYTNE